MPHDEGKRREQLHPELAEYLIETPTGLMLDHPLVRDMDVDPDRAAILNRRYRKAREALDDAIRKRDWSKYIDVHERPHRLAAFIEIADVLPDKKYWGLLSDIWVDSENISQDLSDWRAQWNDDRAEKHYAMDAKERKAFKRLSSEIIIYRGIGERRAAHGMSWTLDRDRAIWFAKRFAHYGQPPILLTARAKKSDVYALLLGRNENEIVIDQFEIVATEYVT